MTNPSYAYFDETYFQDGSQKGTAYTNYKQAARGSKTFKEIASAVIEIFEPSRVLEIGCATGAIVRHLNDLGCEAHGIDVSEWAVKNAEDENVRLASADDLPFPDASFDLVISCHSLEHLPAFVFNDSLREICRVSSRFLFHMLPMVGTPPYLGDPEIVRQQLRKDPTHQQLHTKSEWTDYFGRLGCIPIPATVLFSNENSNAELSSGQFLLRKDETVDPSSVLRRAVERSQRLFRDLWLRSRSQSSFNVPSTASVRLEYSDRIWKDAECKLAGEDVINLTGLTLRLVILIDGSPCSLRFAAGQDTATEEYANVGEYHLSAKPGCNVYTFSCGELSTLRGSPDYSAINHIAVGGANENSSATIFLCDETGCPLLKSCIG